MLQNRLEQSSDIEVLSLREDFSSFSKMIILYLSQIKLYQLFVKA